MLRIACATDNKKTFCNSHFGDANIYMIYDVDGEKINFIKIIENPNKDHDEDDDKNHRGDPVKADKMKSLLDNEKIQVMLANRIGQNIIKMRETFLPIISRLTDIKETLEVIRENYDIIDKQLNDYKQKHLIVDKDGILH